MPDLFGFKFDIQQMDLHKVFRKLFEKKSLFAVGVVLVVALIAALALWKNYSSKLTDYQSEIQQTHQKIDIIAAHDQSLKELNKFTSFLAKPLSQEMLIHQLTDYAAQNQVDILNITPKETRSENFYTISVVQLNVTAGSFKNLLLFLRAVETSPYTLRVESWSARSQDDLGAGSIECEMNVASIEIKT